MFVSGVDPIVPVVTPVNPEPPMVIDVATLFGPVLGDTVVIDGGDPARTVYLELAFGTLVPPGVVTVMS